MMLHTFNFYLLEEHNLLKQSIEEYRRCKMNKYRNKRTEVCTTMMKNLSITIDIGIIIQWYDLWDYSTMELVDFDHFIMILNHVELLKNIPIDIKSNLFHLVCTMYVNKSILHEIILFLLLFHDPSPIFVHLQKDFIDQYQNIYCN